MIDKKKDDLVSVYMECANFSNKVNCEIKQSFKKLVDPDSETFYESFCLDDVLKAFAIRDVLVEIATAIEQRLNDKYDNHTKLTHCDDCDFFE